MSECINFMAKVHQTSPGAIGDDDLLRAASKAMTFPVPLQYEAIERLLSSFHSSSLIKRFAEGGLIGRLVHELKEGVSHPHLNSISCILDLMLQLDFFVTLPEDLLPACITILKEAVARSLITSHIFSLLTRIACVPRFHKDFIVMDGLKWFCKYYIKKGDKYCVEKLMSSLQSLAAAEDPELLRTMAIEYQLIDLLEETLTTSNSYSILKTVTFIYCHLSVRGGFSITPKLVPLLAPPVLDILRTPSSPLFFPTFIQFLLIMADLSQHDVISANGLEVASSLFQRTTGEQRLAALAVLYIARQDYISNPLTIEIVAYISPSIMFMPFKTQLLFVIFMHITCPLDLT